MAVFNRFDDPATERAYIAEERARWRPGLRALAVIGMGIIVLFLLIHPVFLQGSLAIYNLTSGAILLALGIAWLVIGTDYYLRWRWLDALCFTALVLGTATTFLALEANVPETRATFYPGSVIVLAVVVVFAAVCFVANFRAYLLWVAGVMAVYLAFLASREVPLVGMIYLSANMAMFVSFALFVNWVLDYRARIIFSTNRELAAEKAKTEDLLYNVLPQAIAQRLRAGEAVADSFSDVSVIFTDIVGFSVLAKTLSPGHLVRLLNRFFSVADLCAERYGVEKVKTIGDAYLAVAGGTASSGHGACEAVDFARALIDEVKALAEETGINIQLRAGVHTGPVVGGVVGSSRLAYDYWGDTMNIASRIEGVAEPNGVAVSSATYHACGNRFDWGAPEDLILKGVGETKVYRLAS